jgi:hypothetical protein
MPDEKELTFSRRQVLGGLGAFGLASAGAGLGMSRLFDDGASDRNDRVAAGEPVLKVGWEERYSYPQLYGFDDPAAGLRVARSDPGSDSHVGLPDPDSPVVWVHEDDLAAYVSNTAIEAFPDPDDDGERERQTDSFTYELREDGADSAADLDPGKSGATRTGRPYTTNDGDPEPIVSLDNVAPGDFGVFTFSYHLRSDPGYVWLRAANVEASENGHTESEAAGGDSTEGDGDSAPGGGDSTPGDGDSTLGHGDSPPADGGNGELAENIRTVWWYDDGDGVLGRGSCDEDDRYLEDDTDGDLAGRDICERRISGLGGTLEDDLDALENDPVVLEPRANPGNPCLEPGVTRHVGFAWWIPDDVGNEIQRDSLSFDLVFEVEQCRDGGNAFASG